MMGHIWTQAEFLLRIFLAGICGGMIGYERTNRGKGAGIRTHMIVAIAAALMMLVSKYGFADLPINELGSRGTDPSRIAAQIVSGVGFLGAGMIFIQKHAIKGLTTAAGIWATAGIGMAIGSGMYTLGISTAVIVLVVQVILHKNRKLTHVSAEENMTFVIYDNEEAIEYLKNYFKENDIQTEEMGFKKISDTELEVNTVLSLPIGFEAISVLDVDRKYIKSVII